MASNLNEDKTEVIVLGSRQLTSRITIRSVTFGNSVIPISSKVRDLGLMLDSNLTFHDHVSNVSSASFAALKTIARVRRSLTAEQCLLLVNALIMSRVLFCFTALNGITNQEMNRIQRLLKASLRTVRSCCSPGEDITSRARLLLLPVKSLLMFRSAILAYSVVDSCRPTYLHGLLCSKDSSRHLRSADRLKYAVPACRTNMGRRAFSVYAALLLNSLPLCLRGGLTTTAFKGNLLNFLLGV